MTNEEAEVKRYEPREIEGRWAIYDTVENRVTGLFGRGEDERRSAASHALQMNEAVGGDQDALGFHAAMARHEVLSQKPKPRGEQREP